MKTQIGGRTTTCLSMSAIKDFLNCRRKFWFRYVEGLVPMVRETPLSFGSASHACLSAVLKAQGKLSKEELLHIALAEYNAEEIQAAGVLPKVAVEAVVAFDKYSNWREQLTIVSADEYFSVSMGHGKRLHGYFDGRVMDKSNNLLLLENKFLASISEDYIHHLLWDDQASYYLVACRKLGYAVNGIFYNLIQKPTIDQRKATPEDKRKYTKDGKLYASQYDKDETDEEYLARIETWYAEHVQTAFFSQMVMRNATQLDELEKRFDILVADLRQCNKSGAYYPNGDACAMRGCPFSSICLEDTPEVRQANFIQRKEENGNKPAIP